VPQLKEVYIFNGCTVSRMLIGRALTKLKLVAKPKKIQVEASWAERVSKNGARKSDRL
jgi:hypothetical protein